MASKGEWYLKSLGFIKGFGSNVNIFKVQYVKYEGELWTNEPQSFFRTS